ncbi:reverse transcriptase domain-containing protein [Dankookia sp. GCM10030260]|uniref:reverse transcriptase/maturase family protein n=1 Tax=Dankookia sp. GCM10030260 TaxID=3273390 RepID=UPI0036135990
MIRMDYKVLQRLEALRKVNANPTWVNDDLYRLMYKSDLYVTAYERIKSSPGNMTPGVDEKTLDGFSMVTIENIIKEMRNESFVFSRARRIQIPKANGGKRPLGIATPKDKVVQEAIRLILECIYESPHGPTFRGCSHGFRPQRGTHTALRTIRIDWQAIGWMIEGDIKGCFDNIDHDVLIGVLRKRIRDERFINLLRKALKAGYMEFHTPVNSIVGTPQGSIVSPLLANIYLHELDEFVEDKIRRSYERGGTKRMTTQHRTLSQQISKLSKAIDSAEGTARKELVRRVTQMRSRLSRTPSMRNDEGPIRIRYIRYADDWMIGVDGPKQTAEAIKKDVADFLDENLRLTLSMEKTHIRHAKTEEAFFLGTRIKVGSTSRRVVNIRRNGKVFPKRVTGWQPQLRAPVDKIVRRLAGRGFCDPSGSPCHKADWEQLDDDQLVELYSSINRGYLNFYSFSANYAGLSQIQYILKYSLAKTLARKHRTSVAKVFAKRGDPPRVSAPTAGGKNRTVTFHQERNWAADTLRFRTTDAGTPKDGMINTQTRLRTRSKLGKHCCICGKADGVEMHHIRHVLKMGQKTTGFARLMATINRKQIPVCKEHHDAIHGGLYDGIGLGSLYDPELAAA